MKKWFILIVSIALILIFSAFLNQSFTADEKTILTNGIGIPFYEQLELMSVLYDNNMVRKSLLDKYKSTGNSEYYRSYLDSGYTANTFFNLTKERKLTSTEFNILIVTLRANNAYYFNHTSLQNDDQIGIFLQKLHTTPIIYL